MSETVLNQEESKTFPVTEVSQPKISLKRVAGIVLSMALIAMTLYVLNLQNQNSKILSTSTQVALSASNHATINYMAYVGRYKQTKIELDETTRKLEEVNRQLDQVTAELATTKGMLTQTQGMLSQAQDENVKLKQELQGLDNMRNTENVQNIGQLQAKIQSLKERDSQVSLQLDQLKEQLRAFEADVSSIPEGRSLITLFQSKIRLVKSRMHYLKQQAYYARVAAQKEKDRLAALNGNSGFVVRNGEAQRPEATKKSFAIDVKVVQ